MVFLNAADQAKAGDGVDTIMSTLGDQVTATDSNGKTMTDSTGYQIAAYQSNVTLSSDYSAYGLGFSTILTGILTKLTSTLTEGGSTALSAARVTCKLADNIIFDIISSCPTVLNPATVPVAISLGIGGITADLFVCAVVATVSTAAISKAFSEALEKIVPALATSALPTLTSETIGEAGGDALYSGTASILGSKAAAYGLSAGNTEEIEQYAVDTASIKQQESKIASYDAKDDPFDATNSYSFLGSIIKTLNISSLYNNLSFLSAIKSLFSIIPSSFASLTSFAGAETLNISSVYSSDKCTDSSLTSIGVSADSLCNPSYVMSSDELNADINEVIDYMIKNNQIDEDTGEAIAGSDYEKYLNNCANRTEPLGETSSSITDGSITDNDYAWKIGLYCTDPDNDDIKEKLPYFHTYTMDKAIEDMTDEDFSSSSTSTSSSADSEQPENTDTLGSGWTLKNGVDYSSIPCATGTTDNGVYTHPTNGYTIRLCGIDGFGGKGVASIISQRVIDLVNAAAAAGYTIRATDTFRSYEAQVAAHKNKPNLAATPGKSQHERGLAIDFNNGGGDWSGIKSWLDTHAKEYSLINYSAEEWHWSTSGH